MNDVNALDLISYGPRSFYVTDKAYIDFKRLYHLHWQRAFFVTRARYHDCETNKELIFLTKNMELKPAEIAYLYKKHWEVELFFKWMKQHLKIKSF